MTVESRDLEGSVQMKLYTLSKRHFLLVLAAFFISFAVVVIIGIAGPQVFDSYEENATTAVKSTDVKQHGPYLLRTPRLSRLNKQLFLIVQFSTHDERKGTFTEPFTVWSQVRGFIYDEEDAGDNQKNPNVSFVAPIINSNRSHQLHCVKSECLNIILVYLPYLDFTQYEFRISFYDLPLKIPHDVFFYLKTFHAGFTELEIWFRFIFLLLTFVCTCLFVQSLRRFPVRDWSIEQRWMTLLLPLLLLYNDPLFPLTFLGDAWWLLAVDTTFQLTFLSALLLFWLCVYHGVRQRERHFVPFYVPKLIIVGLLWLASVLLSFRESYYQKIDPTYKSNGDSLTGTIIFFFVMGFLYLLYLAYQIVRSYAELRSLPYFDTRLKFSTFLMLVVLLVTVTILSLRFSKLPVGDRFTPNLASRFESSAEFLSFYGLLNLYTYTMAFVYSPSKNAAIESHFKDNPTISMLNESDDEVVFTYPRYLFELRSSGRGQNTRRNRKVSSGKHPYADDDDLLAY